MTAPLPRGFFARPAEEVAPELLGCDLVRIEGETTLRARIIETEAYGPHDPASHSVKGQTPRNASMFGPPGHLYVYRSHGIHWCLNVVTGSPGVGSAVLLRAAVPLEGLDLMRARRGREHARELCSGPGNVCSSFGIDGSFDGLDLLHNPLGVSIETAVIVAAQDIQATPRIGISRGEDTPWRFIVRTDAVGGSST